MRRVRVAGWLLLAACGQGKELGAEGGAPPSVARRPHAPPAVEAPVAAPPAPVAPKVPVAVTVRMAARHVLVAWAGAAAAPPNVGRTKEQARARAEEVLARLARGDDFGAVAREMSDDASASMGGDLGAFEPGVMVPVFEQTVASLPLEGRSGLVESPFGYHVIERLPVREVHLQHFIVSWSGAERAPASVKRTRDEARALAEAARAEVLGGAPWDEVVARTSDGPARDDGGELGWMGPAQLMRSLDAPAFALAPGEVSAVIETPRGFHVLRRSE